MSELRDAASLILLRPEPAGWRILMGLRHAGHRFLPNRMVFPGGGVDPDDFGAPLKAPLRPAVLHRLGRAAGPALAHAIGHAAARELAEETGLTLGTPPDLSPLHYLCRAETPAERPIRFNARFFVTNAAHVTGTLAGSGELESLDWYALDDILPLDLAFATRAVLDQLQIWLALPESARDAAAIPVLRDRLWQDE
jgi:8-oxo-dGTP pyrophosphatase MutT (NUDIX family)